MFALACLTLHTLLAYKAALQYTCVLSFSPCPYLCIWQPQKTLTASAMLPKQHEHIIEQQTTPTL